MRTLLAGLVGFLFLGLVAPASAERDFLRNDAANQFGSLDMPAYARYRGEPVEIVATLVLNESLDLRAVTRVLFAFRVSSTLAHVHFVNMTTATGEEVPATIDERGDSDTEAKVIVSASSLPPPGGAIRLNAIASATQNGRWHVGAMVIGFDETWDTWGTPDGGSAFLYAFTILGAEGLQGQGAPFQGRGNDMGFVWGAGLIVFGLVTLFVAADRALTPPTGPERKPPSGPAPGLPALRTSSRTSR